MATKFKVGDRAKWTGAAANWPYGIVTVTKLKTASHRFYIGATDDTGQHEGSFAEDELELIPALPPNSPAILPADAAERKKVPIGTGVMDYFPAALAEVAKISYAGNQQHNPGEPLHWARGKSTDQADTMLRHFLERGTLDSDGQRHSAKMCWRALAILQLELEAEGAPVARGAKS